MSTVLTSRQEEGLIAAATVRRQLQVPETWVMVRLGVLVDARAPGVREVAAHAVAVQLAAEMAGHLRVPPSTSTHGHDRAAAVLQDMRVRLASTSPGGWRFVVAGDSHPDVAAELLAAHPHGALVVAVALCGGHALAAAWS